VACRVAAMAPYRSRAKAIPLPPKQIQSSISYILSTLDDKIELNRQTNETLEAMAQALFKSWFVDFELVMVRPFSDGAKFQ